MWGLAKNKAAYRIRRFMSSILVVVLAVAVLAGCGGTGTKEEVDASSVGDYKAYDISEIEGLQYVYSLNQVGAQFIVLGEDDERKILRYTSADEGVTWSESEIKTGVSAPDASDENALMAVAASTDAEGKAVVGYVEMDTQGKVAGCSIWSEATGKKAVIDVPNIGSLACVSGGDALYVYDGESVGRYTLSGSTDDMDIEADEVKNDGHAVDSDSADSLTYTSAYAISTGGIIDFCEMDGELYVLTEKEIVRYDSETGEKLEMDTGLMSVLEAEIQKTASRMGTEAVSCRRVMRAGTDGKLYLMLEDGFYSYSVNGGLATRIVGEDIDGWKDSSDIIYDFAFDEEDTNVTVFALCSGTDAKRLVGYSTQEMAVSERVVSHFYVLHFPHA